MAERGVQVDHATLNRWVVKYSRLIANEALRRKVRTNKSWRMDKTYIKVKDKRCYYYRAVDKAPLSDASIACRAMGKTLDFMLSEKRDEAAATAFFRRAIGNNGFPDRIVIDKSGSNMAGLNNVIEQDHRFIKALTKQMMGFKSLDSSLAILDGIDVAHMILTQQVGVSGNSPFHQFAALAG